ncbi:hypothetical protein Tco_1505131 [Tanacetum coccineum]
MVWRPLLRPRVRSLVRPMLGLMLRIRHILDYHTDIRTYIAADFESHAQVGVEAEIKAESKESDGDMIEIGVDVVHPEPETPSMTTQRLEEIEKELKLAKYHAVIVCDEKIIHIKNQPQAARECQKNYADVRRKSIKSQVEIKVGTVAYRLELPEKLSIIHKYFPCAKQKKCLSDETLDIPLDEIQIDDKLHLIKGPIEIMDREVKRLKQSRIPIVKS